MSYCKLYIDANFDLDEMEGVFALGFKECICISMAEYSLFVNDSRVEGASITSSTYPVDRSRYYVEIDSVSNMDNEDNFNRALVELVIWLRLKCDFVVASCDFEDYITEVTGWNWTPEPA
ncbi:hypothetical protein [Leeia aquatica]|uniref:Uncharacterized protein n=1 Tax=Leeia aquatica TaxID=2725557 RepID=A0A847SAL1_9NEIS|nr:hypothetical protein [Leeia aquatica]NLR74369.1 hypothetical protein [Leeia aquatica]